MGLTVFLLAADVSCCPLIFQLIHKAEEFRCLFFSVFFHWGSGRGRRVNACFFMELFHMITSADYLQ
jgi:hypothetical protein